MLRVSGGARRDHRACCTDRRVGLWGPNPKDDSPAISNCIAAFQRQAERGITAGGGPKAGEPGPLNCDHFFQGNESIGNGWPPPPFQG